MLPFCDRVICVDRSQYLPTHNRKILVPTDPSTIGGHLRRRRLQIRLHQSQAACQLGVSTVTLSRWECDKVYPTWEFQPRLVAYLGYDPFDNPILVRPKGNESIGVANLSSGGSISFGQKARELRLKLRLNQKECAQNLGVCAKTLRGWEIGRHAPSQDVQARTLEMLLGGRFTQHNLTRRM